MGVPLRVLLVEDSEDDALLVLRELRRAGYDPFHERVDSPEAMDGALERGTWDLVLGDYNMPHFSGTAALSLLQQRGTDAPFIFVSGTIGEDIAVAAMKAGAQDYVMKGNLKRLVPAIQRELREAEVRRERRRAQEALLERARLAELNSDVGIALSHALIVPEMLERCANAIVRHLDAALTRIWTWNEEAGVLELQASAGAETRIDGPAARVRLGDAGIGLIAQERRAFLTNRPSHDVHVPDEPWAGRGEGGAFAGYPLSFQGRLVGVVAVYSSHAFTDFAAKALGAVADSLAIGVEHKRAEEALRRSETTYRSLVEDSSYGIFSCTPDGRLLAVNPAMVDMLGYESPADLLQRNMADIAAAPEDRARFSQDVIEQGRRSIETAWRRKDGRTLTVRETARVVRDAQGKPEHFTIIVEDVSERRLLEMQLRQAQKMEAIGRLAGGVAHDFNNLLTAILGFADLQLEELPAQHPAREEGEEIRRAALRAAELTRQLLAFSRQQMLAPRVLSVNEIVSGMEKMLRRLIGEDVDFHTSLPEELGLVRIDPGQLEQVIVNLAVNARDAMPGGGKLTIETADTDLDEVYAREYGPVEPGAYVLLAVTDTGAGMDADTRARIFEPFFTTKPKGQGTGLGLATVYGIIKQSGGHIWVYSEPGRGTAFKIYLPRVAEAAQPVELAAEPGRSLQGSETILLVEDQDEVRMLTRRVLEARGYTVLSARNGAEALSAARSHGARIHLLLTDVIMPGMSGREVSQALAPQVPGMRVLYLSGYADASIVHQGAIDPDAAFLQKPFTADALTRKVRGVLDARDPA